MNQAFAARGWRGFCQNFLRSRQQAVIEPVDEASFAASAIVFAPHQDDETLGCGGTIICKRLAGVKIKIVYLTDGSGANAHLGVVAPDELRQIREAEAIVAAQTLGVAAENVVFLNFQDGQLQRSRKEAIAAVVEILRQEQPQEVFMPYRWEPQFVPDHGATQQIVTAALRQTQCDLTVYEYPIWFWFNYPWVDLMGDRIIPKPKRLRLLLQWIGWAIQALWLGYFFQRDFRWAIEVSEYLDLKHQALYQHQSQMTKFRGDARWLTIADIADGEFLSYFFQPQEVFYRYRSRSSKKLSPQVYNDAVGSEGTLR
jgi:LmbE family N-acetylglucosaminyl deacetylase